MFTFIEPLRIAKLIIIKAIMIIIKAMYEITVIIILILSTKNMIAIIREEIINKFFSHIFNRLICLV